MSIESHLNRLVKAKAQLESAIADLQQSWVRVSRDGQIAILRRERLHPEEDGMAAVWLSEEDARKVLRQLEFLLTDKL